MRRRAAEQSHGPEPAAHVRQPAEPCSPRRPRTATRLTSGALRASAFQAPQQAYYQTPAQSDVFAALAQAPPVYAPPPAPVYVAPPAPPRDLASAKFGDRRGGLRSDYLGLDLFRSLTDDKELVISHVPHAWKIKFQGAFVLNRRRRPPYAIFMISARWRGSAGSSPLGGASTSSVIAERNDFVKNYQCTDS